MTGDDPQRTYTIDEVKALLQTVVGGILVGGSTEHKVYTLDEVAERTGWSRVSLERDCANGKVEHTWRGRARGLTSKQLANLIAAHRAGGATSDTDPVSEARRASRRNATRQTRRVNA